MMDEESMKQAWVYRYVYWDSDERIEKTSRIYATLEVIRLGLGSPVLDSAITVAGDDVAGGIYVPSNALESDETSDHHRAVALEGEPADGSAGSRVGAQ